MASKRQLVTHTWVIWARMEMLIVYVIPLGVSQAMQLVALRAESGRLEPRWPTAHYYPSELILAAAANTERAQEQTSSHPSLSMVIWVAMAVLIVEVMLVSKVPLRAESGRLGPRCPTAHQYPSELILAAAANA